MTLTIRHVDTCLSCYVPDHCNGETETLVGVPVDGSTTYADLFEGLENEIRWNVDQPEGLTSEDLRAALDDLFANVSDMSKPFDSSLEQPEASEDDGGVGETCFAWFRMSWGDSDA